MTFFATRRITIEKALSCEKCRKRGGSEQWLRRCVLRVLTCPACAMPTLAEVSSGPARTMHFLTTCAHAFDVSWADAAVASLQSPHGTAAHFLSTCVTYPPLPPKKRKKKRRSGGGGFAACRTS